MHIFSLRNINYSKRLSIAFNNIVAYNVALASSLNVLKVNSLLVSVMGSLNIPTTQNLLLSKVVLFILTNFKSASTYV